MGTDVIDLEMLAYDVADMLDRNEYPLDVAANDIRPHLEAFLQRITRGRNPATVVVDLPATMPVADPANNSSYEVAAPAPDGRGRVAEGEYFPGQDECRVSLGELSWRSLDAAEEAAAQILAVSAAVRALRNQIRESGGERR